MNSRLRAATPAVVLAHLAWETPFTVDQIVTRSQARGYLREVRAAAAFLLWEICPLKTWTALGRVMGCGRGSAKRLFAEALGLLVHDRDFSVISIGLIRPIRSSVLEDRS